MWGGKDWTVNHDQEPSQTLRRRAKNNLEQGPGDRGKEAA